MWVTSRGNIEHVIARYNLGHPTKQRKIITWLFIAEAPLHSDFGYWFRNHYYYLVITIDQFTIHQTPRGKLAEVKLVSFRNPDSHIFVYGVKYTVEFSINTGTRYSSRNKTLVTCEFIQSYSLTLINYCPKMWYELRSVIGQSQSHTVMDFSQMY